MRKVGTIQIEEYDYTLPAGRIAKFPLPERDQSKLLFFKGKEISERKFSDLPVLLPSNCLLLFNETRVIQARLHFLKETGARIEIFCLEPVSPSIDFQLAFQEKSSVVWKCLVGNAKRWKSGKLEMKFESKGVQILLTAKMVEKLTDAYLIQFSWEPNHFTFSEIILQTGLVPLPPYLNREALEMDKTRYQTIYAHTDGSVAAPTAGLHFTEKTFQELKLNRIETARLTLHVGAGTFKPVVAQAIGDHEMHIEKIVVSKQTLQQLIAKLDGNIIPVGTTSMRTLESLYWMAVKLKNGDNSMNVEQWDPYQIAFPEHFSPKKALRLLIDFLEKEKLNELRGETKLMIAPGYQFMFAKGLITNFHQPKSTLLLLVSAMIGKQWRNAYDFALTNDFRFLSYGDSCLFIP